MTEIKKRKDFETWKTTKEVADALGLATDTILSFRNTHKELFEGLVMVSPINTIKGVRDALLWNPEAIKILGFNISNRPVDQWKEDVVSEVVEKGMIITDSIKMSKHPENRLQLIKLQSQQIIAIVDEMQNMEERVKQLELKDKFTGIQRKTRNRLRKYNAEIVQEYEIEFWELWKPIRDKYEVSGYDDLSEEEGQEILRYYENTYPKKKRTDKLDYFQ